VAAVWDALIVDVSAKDDAYSYPAFVRVTSVGPADIPRGTRITLRMDAQLTQLRSIATYRGDDPADAVEVVRTEAVEDGAHTIVLTLTEPIPASKSLSISTAVAAPRTLQASKDVFYARVSVEGPEPGSPLQRVTGSETAIAVTRSGAPRPAAAFTGTI
jgi:hypothetical protein